MTVAKTEDLIRALEILLARATLWLNDQGDLTLAEYAALREVSAWYERTGKDLAEQRRIERLTDGKHVLSTLPRGKYVVIETADGWQVYGDGEESFT